jgi:predicted PurR-regulated permease PerM
VVCRRRDRQHREAHPYRLPSPRVTVTRTTGAPPAAISSSPRDEAGTWFSRGVGFVGGGLLAYGVVAGFMGASSVVLLFFVALLLASALEPIVAEVRDRLPVARGAALLLMYGGFLAIVLVIALLIVPGALNQVSPTSRTRSQLR